MNKIKEAQENFLNAILGFYKNNPNQYFTSQDITKKFGLITGKSFWFIHYVLQELRRRKLLEGGEGKGFKYNIEEQKAVIQTQERKMAEFSVRLEKLENALSFYLKKAS